MVESVRHNLNVGSGAVHDQKKSRITISDAQGSAVSAKQATAEASVDVALSVNKLLLYCKSPIFIAFGELIISPL